MVPPICLSLSFLSPLGRVFIETFIRARSGLFLFFFFFFFPLPLLSFYFFTAGRKIDGSKRKSLAPGKIPLLLFSPLVGQKPALPPLSFFPPFPSLHKENIDIWKKARLIQVPRNFRCPFSPSFFFSLFPFFSQPRLPDVVEKIAQIPELLFVSEWFFFFPFFFPSPSLSPPPPRRADLIRQNRYCDSRLSLGTTFLPPPPPFFSPPPPPFREIATRTRQVISRSLVPPTFGSIPFFSLPSLFFFLSPFPVRGTAGGSMHGARANSFRIFLSFCGEGGEGEIFFPLHFSFFLFYLPR